MTDSSRSSSDDGLRQAIEHRVRVAVPVEQLAALAVIARAAIKGAEETKAGTATMELQLADMLSVFPSLAGACKWPQLFDTTAKLIADPATIVVAPTQLPAAPSAATPTVVFQPGAIVVEQPSRGPVRVERLADGGLRLVPEPASQGVAA